MTSLPLVLLAAWGATVVVRRVGAIRDRTIAAVAVGVFSVGVGAVGLDAAARHMALLQPYYAPSVDRWWITPEEAGDLRALTVEVPRDAKVVANPWLGSSFLYLMTGTRLYFPTEKPRWTEQERAVADLADKVSAGSATCAALEEAGARFAIVGGDAPVYGRDQSERDFRGVNSIPESDGLGAAADLRAVQALPADWGAEHGTPEPRHLSGYAAVLGAQTVVGIIQMVVLLATVGPLAWADLSVGQVFGLVGATVVTCGLGSFGASVVASIPEPERASLYWSTVRPRLLLVTIVGPVVLVSATLLASKEGLAASMTAASALASAVGASWYFVDEPDPASGCCSRSRPRLQELSPGAWPPRPLTRHPTSPRSSSSAR